MPIAMMMIGDIPAMPMAMMMIGDTPATMITVTPTAIRLMSTADVRAPLGTDMAPQGTDMGMQPHPWA